MRNIGRYICSQQKSISVRDLRYLTFTRYETRKITLYLGYGNKYLHCCDMIHKNFAACNQCIFAFYYKYRSSKFCSFRCRFRIKRTSLSFHFQFRENLDIGVKCDIYSGLRLKITVNMNWSDSVVLIGNLISQNPVEILNAIYILDKPIEADVWFNKKFRHLLKK